MEMPVDDESGHWESKLAQVFASYFQSERERSCYGIVT